MQFKAYEEKFEGIVSALRKIRTRLMGNPDCLKSEVMVSDNRELKVSYLEIWQSEASLKAHIRSELYRDILSIMEWAVEIPAVNFYTITEAGGLDLITKLRK